MKPDKIPFKLSDLTYIAFLRKIVGIIPEEESALIWFINFNDDRIIGAYPYYFLPLTEEEEEILKINNGHLAFGEGR